MYLISLIIQKYLPESFDNDPDTVSHKVFHVSQNVGYIGTHADTQM